MTQQRRTRFVRVGTIAATAVGALLIAGCSGTGGGDTDADGGQQEFSLSYGISNTAESAYEILAQKYMEENPNVTIEINALPGDTYPQTLRTQLQAGNSADVVVTQPGSGTTQSTVPLAEAGLLAPLGDTAASLIPEGSEALFNYEDQTYGQALDRVVTANNFNVMGAEAAGFEYPATWDDLIATCEDLAAEGQSLFVVAGSIPVNTGVVAQIIATTRVYAEDPEWNQKRADGDVTFAESEGWQDTLQSIVDMHEAGCFQPGVEGAGFDAISNNLLQGTSYAMFGPSGASRELTAVSEGKASFLVEPFPVAEEGDRLVTISTTNYAYSIAAASENKEAAQEFLDWMGEPAQAQEFAEIQGNLPIVGIEDVDLTDSVFAPVAELIAAGDYIPAPNSTWSNAAVYDALGAGVQGLLTGQKTVEQVLADMDAAW